MVDPQYYTIYASKEILVASLHNTGSHTYAYIVYLSYFAYFDITKATLMAGLYSGSQLFWCRLDVGGGP